MTERITCPRCGQQLASEQDICPHCGIPLAIAAVLTENAMVKQFAAPDTVPLSPEILVPKLGDHLVERGLLTDKQLSKALKIQKDQSAKGNYQLLGQILIEQAFITEHDLDISITEQIVQLQDALKKSNAQLELRVRERTEELQKALTKITELNRLKTNFVSNVSHELRTPLAHMVGYIELLRDGSLGETNPEQDRALNVLVKSYNRLHGLIDELIEFSLVSQGEMSLIQEPVAVKMLVDSIKSIIQKLANEKHVVLTINEPKEDVTILADRSKISWVLGELIENGIKFNRPGGKVSVQIQEMNGVVNFQVDDDGIGFDSHQLEEIFEPFHQLDGSSTRRYGGTGIGLSLSKQIIEAHGSTLKVKSVLDQGSSFEFSLPTG